MIIPRRNYYLNDYFDLFNETKEYEYMKTDIYEKENHYIIEIDLPGITKNNIHINYENGYLSISAIKSNITNNTYIRRERFYGKITRSFYIGNKKESNITANYKEGILTISFPKEDTPTEIKRNINIT